MPTVSEMASDEATATITVGGRPINVVYFPNKITTKACNIMADGLDGVNQTLSEVVKSWDLLNDDDTMYPLDIDSLEKLGIGLVKKVAWGIVNDFRPN